MWVFDEELGLNCRDVTFVPGLYKIFDEILGERCPQGAPRCTAVVQSPLKASIFLLMRFCGVLPCTSPNVCPTRRYVAAPRWVFAFVLLKTPCDSHLLLRFMSFVLLENTL